MNATYRAMMLAAAGFPFVFSRSSFGDSTNPLIGRWVLDVQKSTFDPGPPLKSHTNTITDAGNGALHFEVTLVERDGKKHHREMMASPGRATAVSGAADYVDSAIVIFREPGTYQVVFQKAGRQVESAKFTLSKDGKELYGDLAGEENGTRWKYHYISERQLDVR